VSCIYIQDWNCGWHKKNNL